MDWVLSEGLRSRLAAQRTQLLYFHAALVDPGTDDVPRGQRTVADHLAWRVLDWLHARRPNA
ncbi:MAG TPA: hypothetical protein VFR86_29200 [Burkholderiaceae bacterium]|nr:hypothetical protein [Burkholderiaceae bacterium]